MDPLPPRPKRPRRFLYVTVAWLLCAVLLLAGSRLQRGLTELRREYGFVPAEVENLPWQLAFVTVALGGFRGLIVDMLWIRAMRMQEDAKYFEMVQLADWITKLEPGFSTIWTMQAWNLAYNISVKFPDYEDRWRWVSKGISLLRDQAIRFNPDKPELYRELGWMFQHKIGGNSDDAHWVYKRHLAEMMEEVFGGAEPDFDALIDAPSWEEILQDPEGGALVKDLKEADFDLRRDWLDWVRRKKEPPAAAKEILEDPDRKDALDRVLLSLRAERLRTVFKLDPSLMREIDRQRGPLDWRAAPSHAIYWATRGLQVAGGENLPCERMIFQCMNISFEQGRIILNEDGTIFTTPNVRIIPAVNRAYEEAEEKYKEVNIASAHRNFVRNAIFYLYTFADRDGARQWLEYARKKFGSDEFKPDLDTYVMNRVLEEVQQADTEETQAIIEGALWQAFYWMAAGDDEQAAGFEGLARLVWNRVMQELGDEEVRQRVGLPPLTRIRDDVLQRCLQQFPPLMSERLRARLAQEE